MVKYPNNKVSHVSHYSSFQFVTMSHQILLKCVKIMLSYNLSKLSQFYNINNLFTRVTICVTKLFMILLQQSQFCYRSPIFTTITICVLVSNHCHKCHIIHCHMSHKSQVSPFCHIYHNFTKTLLIRFKNSVTTVTIKV